MVEKETFLKEQDEFYDKHVKFHSPNAFCGSAGPEEMSHIETLVADLSDSELACILEADDFKFENADREDYENVLEEVDREVFYREYKKIMARHKAGNSRA